MTNGRKDTIWQSSEVVNRYLTGIRGAIPFAAEQLDIMVRLLGVADRPVKTFIDLGCGGGALGAAILDRYSDARGIFVDFSPAMLDAARESLDNNARASFLNLDYGLPEWTASVQADGPFDAIVSGYSIHHQPDARKQSLYAEIFDLLAPGGVFVNIEHVSPTSPLSQRLFEEHIIDNLVANEQRDGGSRTREELAHLFHSREDREANILAPIDDQLRWLCDIGFTDADCHFKLYELAILAGSKPVA